MSHSGASSNYAQDGARDRVLARPMGQQYESYNRAHPFDVYQGNRERIYQAYGFYPETIEVGIPYFDIIGKKLSTIFFSYHHVVCSRMGKFLGGFLPQHYRES